MTTVYKLTTQALTTHNHYRWTLNEEYTTTGVGPLCGPGWLHAYTHPLLAVLLNPAHANIASPRLFEAEGEIGLTDRGFKVGCSRLRLVRELPLPAVTTEQRVRFAILCALEVYGHPAFAAWTQAWMDGTDRSAEAAEEAAEAAARAADEAEAVAWAAAAVAWAVAWAARAADEAEAVAWAVAWAAAAARAAGTTLDLIALAEQAVAHGSTPE